MFDNKTIGDTSVAEGPITFGQISPQYSTQWSRRTRDFRVVYPVQFCTTLESLLDPYWETQTLSKNLPFWPDPDFLSRLSDKVRIQLDQYGLGLCRLFSHTHYITMIQTAVHYAALVVRSPTTQQLDLAKLFGIRTMRTDSILQQKDVCPSVHEEHVMIMSVFLSILWLYDEVFDSALPDSSFDTVNTEIEILKRGLNGDALLHSANESSPTLSMVYALSRSLCGLFELLAQAGWTRDSDEIVKFKSFMIEHFGAHAFEYLAAKRRYTLSLSEFRSIRRDSGGMCPTILLSMMFYRRECYLAGMIEKPLLPTFAWEMTNSINDHCCDINDLVSIDKDLQEGVPSVAFCSDTIGASVQDRLLFCSNLLDRAYYGFLQQDFEEPEMISGFNVLFGNALAHLQIARWSGGIMKVRSIWKFRESRSLV